MENSTILSLYYCDVCKTECHKKNNYEKHLLTAKHKKMSDAMDNFHFSTILSCDICDINFANNKDYQKHLLTAKHKKKSSCNESSIHFSKNYPCSQCGKKYASNSGLWRHKQQCKNALQSETYTETHDVETEIDIMQFTKQKLQDMITPELVMMLIQQNKEMQNMMMEQNKTMLELAKNAGHNNTTNIQNNHNKAFNMNFFLNETCKNAMNMSDFVKNLVVTTDDFEQTGILGYAEGISRILENGLKKLELHERPIHCSDVKRETIYIRENDKWEKDDDQKTRLLEAIKQVGAKNINMIPQWCKEHPGWCDSESKENDKYLKYVYNSMCGGTDEEIRNNYGNIMRHISRITIVDKKEHSVI
jgi:hypothetical protein